jgi:hypothetical protein
VRLTDFGLSKIAKDKTHSICGTPQFLAPEMILYAKTTGYNVMVDWWALGIVIHEMASCVLPFDEENHQQLYRKIVYEAPVLPQFFGAELCSLLEGLLTKDPSKRLGQNVEDDLKQHPFFASINWQKLLAKEMEPPFVPKLKKATDTTYFYKSFTTAAKTDSVALISVTDETQERFRNFSFTNLTELTGDAGADGTLDDEGEGSEGRTPQKKKSLGGGKVGEDDELTLVLNPLLMKLPSARPDFVVVHKNPLWQDAVTRQLVAEYLKKDESPSCQIPPTQLSVHPWPQLMAEAPEHSSWGKQLHVPEADDWWGGPEEPQQVVVVGRGLQGWPVPEQGEAGRLTDESLSYVFVDSLKRHVGLWHGPKSGSALRARATRIGLTLAQESQQSLVLCPASAVRIAATSLHDAPPEPFPRSVGEAQSELSYAVPESRCLVFCDGRTEAQQYLWVPQGESESAVAAACKNYPDCKVEREGAESAVFRAQFRITWGPSGDVPLREAKAKYRYVSRRPFEASCSRGHEIQVLGEGEVPHWCYIYNVSTASRGVVPLSIFGAEEGETEIEGGEDKGGGTLEPPPPLSPKGRQVRASVKGSRGSAKRQSKGNLTGRSSLGTPRTKATPRNTPRQGGEQEDSGTSFPGIKLRLVANDGRSLSSGALNQGSGASFSNPSSPKDKASSPGRGPSSPKAKGGPTVFKLSSSLTSSPQLKPRDKKGVKRSGFEGELAASPKSVENSPVPLKPLSRSDGAALEEDVAEFSAEDEEDKEKEDVEEIDYSESTDGNDKKDSSDSEVLIFEA